MRNNPNYLVIYTKNAARRSLPVAADSRGFIFRQRQTAAKTIINIQVIILIILLTVGSMMLAGCKRRESSSVLTRQEVASAPCSPGQSSYVASETAKVSEGAQSFENAADIITEEPSKKLETDNVPSMSGAAKQKKTKLTTITINAAGDCTFGSDYKSPASVNFYAVYNKKKNPAYFFKNVKKFFAKDDLTLVNLEGTLTERTTRMDKTYAFRGSPSYVKILKKASIEAVSFANNHCQDFGPGSYTDTIATLKKADVKYASYGKVSIFKAKGIKIGMVAVNGLLGYASSKEYIQSGIKKLKKRKADMVIVSMHAGVEHTSALNSVQTGLAHYAVQQGANLVLGHHPHVLQGIEKYRGAYIVYSLGNFCFGGNTNPSDKDTMIFKQSFTFRGKKLLKKKSQARVIPCRISSTTTINNYQPTPLKGNEKRRVISRLNTYSRPFGVTVKKNGVLKK